MITNCCLLQTRCPRSGEKALPLLPPPLPPPSTPSLPLPMTFNKKLCYCLMRSTLSKIGNNNQHCRSFLSRNQRSRISDSRGLVRRLEPADLTWSPEAVRRSSGRLLGAISRSETRDDLSHWDAKIGPAAGTADAETKPPPAAPHPHPPARNLNLSPRPLSVSVCVPVSVSLSLSLSLSLCLSVSVCLISLSPSPSLPPHCLMQRTRISVNLRKTRKMYDQSGTF